MMAAVVNLDREKPPSPTFPPPPSGPARPLCVAVRAGGGRRDAAHFRAPARRVVGVSAHGGEVLDMPCKISLHADFFG